MAIIEAWHRKVPHLKGSYPGTLTVCISGAEINAVYEEICSSKMLRWKLFWKAQLVYDIDPAGTVAEIIRELKSV